jgi:cytochrome P450
LDPEEWISPHRWAHWEHQPASVAPRRGAQISLSGEASQPFCVGALLARQEMKCAIREIVNGVDSLELAVPPEQLDLSNSIVILRGLKSLPVRFRTRTA